MPIKNALSLLLFSFSLLTALFYNGKTIDLLVFSVLSLTLFSLLIKDKSQLSITALVLFSAVLLFNYQLSINSEWSLLIITGLMMGFATFWLFSTQALQQNWHYFRMAAVGIILLTSLLGCWHYLVTLRRIDAQMLDANVFAITQYIAFFLLLSMPEGKTRGAILLRGLLFFLVLFAFFASYSRSGMAAWLGALGGVMVMSLLKPLFSRSLLVAVTVGALTVYSLVMILPLLFGDGAIIRGFGMSHLSSRIYIWEATWTLIQKMPLTGYGLGAFMNLYSGERLEFGSAGFFAHNDYLQLLLEGGPLFLGLLLAYVAFYGWLGFRIVFTRREQIEEEHRELLAYVAIAMALSAHALLNYVFYVLSVQLLVGMVLARTVFLARKLGYLKVPAVRPGRLGMGVPLVMLLLTSSLVVLTVSRKALMDVGSFPVPDSWVKSAPFAEKVLAIDPDNQAAQMHLFNQLFFGLEAAEEAQQQRIFEISYDLGMQLIMDYPFDSDYYWRQGILLEKAGVLGLNLAKAEGRSPKDYYIKALKLNPGNMPANSSMLDLMLTEGRIGEAENMLKVARQWEPLVRAEDRKLLLDMVEKLNDQG
ncbi:O-antigen ligase family protein [Endozoicomonas atrinae]|uniref:O-antigen ligase family protein n=1 Tax=Endozoicomonas atrinae TaxID=1333660 RepID=UPI003B00956F